MLERLLKDAGGFEALKTTLPGVFGYVKVEELLGGAEEFPGLQPCL